MVRCTHSALGTKAGDELVRILQVNNSDTKGGAARVAYMLGRGLRDRGHAVEYLVKAKHADEDWIVAADLPQPTGQTLQGRFIHRLGLNGLALNSHFPRSLGQSYFEQFDLIHLHDVMGFSFNLTHLAWLSHLRPTVWTLHTMWPLTGGCLYSYDCDRWKHACGTCPQFGKFPLLWLHRDGSRGIRAIKNWTYGRSRLYPVGVSEWISQVAREGILGHFDVNTILNPVDTDLFHPIDKAIAKQKLGIPSEAKTLMFSLAANLLDKRKGVEVILKALPQLQQQGYFLIPLSISSQSGEMARVFAQFPSLAPRHITDPAELNLRYNAADLLWHPSLADTSSLVTLEAFAAGTPAIASRVGGVREIVTEGETGWFISPGDATALAQRTDAFFANAERQAIMSRQARQRAETVFSLPQFLDRYERWFTDLTTRPH
ncbi:MAG: glycosyltransferase [Cyanobacteria bacterium J06642_2]